MNIPFFFLLTLALAVNRPNFCPSTTWYPDGITFANQTTIGTEPLRVVVDPNNTVYVINDVASLIRMWYEGSSNPSRTLVGVFNKSYSLFVTRSGDIYVDNGNDYQRIEKWSMNINSSIPDLVMTVPYGCYDLFVDISNTLYCSIGHTDQVVKKWLFDNRTGFAVVAGTGTYGSSSDQLYYPEGLFVDVNFNLYVADRWNNRIQMFPLGQRNGITVAGVSAPGTISLSDPTGVTLDANGYLFISDSSNGRIIGAGSYGFRCIVGCTGTTGSGPRQLSNAQYLSFDTYGNLYVADRYNNRIQKFILASNSCSKSWQYE